MRCDTDPALQLFFLQLKLCVGLLPLKLGSITKDYFYEKKVGMSEGVKRSGRCWLSSKSCP